MFNIFDIAEVHKNPLLVSEFIKIVPAFELAKHVIETKDDDKFSKLLNLKSIRDGILNSDRDDLKLVLATYGDVLELWDSKDFFKLYEKGTGFKAALFSNSNIDWYKLHEADKVEILHKSILADFEDETNKNLILTLVANPRIDRKVIANAMLGIDGFEGLPVTTRLIIAAKAIKVKPIEADHWPGKDSPDTHEIYFTNVNEAFLPMIRDAKVGMDETKFKPYLNHLLWELPFSEIDIKSEYWLSDDELEKLKNEYKTHKQFIDNYYEIKLISLNKAFEFFSDWYQDDEGYPQTTNQICRVGVPILTITSLLRNYWMQDYSHKVVSSLLTSPSLILRAAGYAVIFDNIPVESGSEKVLEFFRQYPEDTLAKWIGITNTPGFWLCDGYGSNGKFIAPHMKASGFSEKINSARNDMYQYLFLHSFSENLEKHNSMRKLDLQLRETSSKVLDKSPFTVDETKIQLPQKEKSLLHKLFN
jgi:hypothetical protein